MNILKPHENIVELFEVCKNETRTCMVFEQLSRTVLDEIQQNKRIELQEARKMVY